jgi:cell division protein FtsL
MKNKLIKKLSTLTLIGALTLSFAVPIISANAATTTNREIVSTSHSLKSVSEFEKEKNDIEKYLVINEDGTIALSDDIPSSYNEKYHLDDLRAHFAKLNKKVKSNDIAFSKDFKVKNVNSSNIKTSGGSNYIEEYWWGASQGYTYSQARTSITSLKKTATISAGIVTLGGYTGSLFAIIGGLVTGGYCFDLASDMEDVNSDNDQAGIVVDVNWAMDYSVYSE